MADVKNEARKEYELKIVNQKDSDKFNGNNFSYKAVVKEAAEENKEDDTEKEPEEGS